MALHASASGPGDNLSYDSYTRSVNSSWGSTNYGSGGSDVEETLSGPQSALQTITSWSSYGPTTTTVSTVTPSVPAPTPPSSAWACCSSAGPGW